MQMKDWLLMFITIGLVSVASGVLITQFYNTYGGNINQTAFSEQFDYLGNVTELSGDIQSTSTDTAGIDESVGFYAYSKKVWEAIKMMLNAPILMNLIIGGVLDIFQLGDFAPYIYTLATIILLFLIISFIWRWYT